MVKVMHQKLGEKYYKKKGVIKEVRDVYTGLVKMIETGDIIKIDQAFLETVIPAIGEGCDSLLCVVIIRYLLNSWCVVTSKEWS